MKKASHKRNIIESSDDEDPDFVPEKPKVQGHTVRKIKSLLEMFNMNFVMYDACAYFFMKKTSFKIKSSNFFIVHMLYQTVLNLIIVGENFVGLNTGS